MKNDRHNAIIDIITNTEVETQEMLATLLMERGYDVTQATISRDIRKLNIVKAPSDNGTSRYVTGGASKNPSPVNPYGVRAGVDNAVVKIEKAGNLVVVKTVPGMAMAVAAMIDAMNISDIVGSIAGDDTIMCAVREVNRVDGVVDMLTVLQ